MIKGYYSLTNILKEHATYNILIGERSNGKTYSILEYALKDYWNNGNQFALLRRMKEDFKSVAAKTYFNSLICNGYKKNVISEITGGTYDKVIYYCSMFYLAKFDEKLNKDVRSLEPLGVCMALSEMEHTKGSSFPKIKTILFDEFISRNGYLPNEFELFVNTISTITRSRTDCVIFMCGNTVSWDCPYFKWFGIANVRKMKQNTIKVYRFGEETSDGKPSLVMAVEYTDTRGKKESDKYFAFNNPSMKMITSGAWEVAVYPTCPCSYERKNVIYSYYIWYGDEKLQADIIQKDMNMFTFIHKQKNNYLPNNSLIFTPELIPLPNYRTRITRPTSPIEEKINSFFIKDRVFYSDNDVGETVRNYILWCTSSRR